MRRLPVINSAAPEDEAAAERPRWQWVLIGAGFTAVFWIPVALLVVPFAVPMADAVTTRVLGFSVLDPEWDGGRSAAVLGMLTALPLVATFIAAAAGAGAVMGRFAKRARARDAAGAAALCAGLLAVLAATRLLPWISLIAFAVLAPAGAASAYVTARRFAAGRSH